MSGEEERERDEGIWVGVARCQSASCCGSCWSQGRGLILSTHFAGSNLSQSHVPIDTTLPPWRQHRSILYVEQDPQDVTNHHKVVCCSNPKTQQTIHHKTADPFLSTKTRHAAAAAAAVRNVSKPCRLVCDVRLFARSLVAHIYPSLLSLDFVAVGCGPLSPQLSAHPLCV